MVRVIHVDLMCGCGCWLGVCTGCYGAGGLLLWCFVPVTIVLCWLSVLGVEC